MIEIKNRRPRYPHATAARLQGERADVLRDGVRLGTVTIKEGEVYAAPRLWDLLSQSEIEEVEEKSK